MNYTENTERQQVLRQALGATTLPEIEAAVRQLRQWVQVHPQDTGIVDAFEQLDLMRRAQEAIADGTGKPVAVN